MTDSVGSLLGRAALAACLMVLSASASRAQEALKNPPPTSVDFMTRFDFHMSAAGLSSEDPRFSWDTHWGGDFDFVDYVKGRLAFLADYEAVLGKENRLFDPNQGNYTLEVSGSARIKQLELVGVLHHVSRHLSDRPNKIAIAYNSVNLRALGRRAFGKTTIAGRLEGGPVVAHAYVDYTGVAFAEAKIDRPVSPRLTVYGTARGDFYLVDSTMYNRSDQQGGRLEGGLRIRGKAGALELFGGWERIVDAYPLDLERLSWAFAGFRLVN
jgi:hypothetical protein